MTKQKLTRKKSERQGETGMISQSKESLARQEKMREETKCGRQVNASMFIISGLSRR